jgi:phage protein D
MAVAEASIAFSRPTIRLGGADARPVTGGLVGARVREDVHGLSDCELEIGNWGDAGGLAGYLYFDRRVLDFGTQVEVSVPDGVLFAGRISAIEARFADGAPPTIVVLAEDRLQDLRMTRRTRTFADVSDADVAARIAGDHGLTCDVAISGPTHRLLAQLDQSDLAFLRERARALDAELRVSGSTLEVKPRGARAASPLTLTLGKDLREFRVVADLAHQRTSVDVSGWDVDGKRAIAESAGDGVLGAELGGGESGPSILRSAFGVRHDPHANAVPQTAAEARTRAESLFLRRARRFVSGHGTAEAAAGLRAGAAVRLAGVGPLFEGDYYVTAVTHRFDIALGLRSELCVERPGLGGPA